jgi:hypothetical protein
MATNTFAEMIRKMPNFHLIRQDKHNIIQRLIVRAATLTDEQYTKIMEKIVAESGIMLNN